MRRRAIRAGPDNDPEKTGIHTPQTPAKFGKEGLFGVAAPDE